MKRKFILHSIIDLIANIIAIFNSGINDYYLVTRNLSKSSITLHNLYNGAIPVDIIYKAYLISLGLILSGYETIKYLILLMIG